MMPLHSVGSVGSFILADTAFRERGDDDRTQEALRLYRELHQNSPDDSDAAWRLSMACQFVGMRLTSDLDDKLRLFAEGREAGLAALRTNPQCAACHFWTAINMALYGDTAGIFKMFFSLKTIEEHLKASLEIDPAYAYAGAYRVLGVIQEKLPGILGGSSAQARVYYEKAIETVPDEPMNYVTLAKILNDTYHDKAAARETIRKGLSFPHPATERVESLGAYRELEALLGGLTQN